MITLTKEQKIESTVKGVRSRVAAGWDLQEAIYNAQNIWHLCNRDMKEVARQVGGVFLTWKERLKAL